MKKTVLHSIPIFVILLTQELFWPFLFENKLLGANRVYYDWAFWLSKLIAFLAVVYSFYAILSIRLKYRVLMGLFLLLYIYLTFESFYYYNNPIEHPPVFFSISSIILTFAIFHIYYKKLDVSVASLMYFIIAGMLMKVLISPGMLSPGAFVSHERGVPVTSVFLILLPAIYFFNDYFVNKNKFSVFIFLVLIYLIFFFQHKTVWVTTIAAFTINFLLLNKRNLLNIQKIFVFMLPLIILGAMSAALVWSYFPDMTEKIGENVDQILNPMQEESTSTWRVEQMKSYMPFVEEHPVFGMRLKGYDLPLQFYEPGTDNVRFGSIEGMGHHFHSFYFDKLFYFGSFSVLLILIIMFRPIFLTYKYNLPLNFSDIAFISYSTSGLIYGLGYNLPFYYWVILGLTLVFVENDIQKKITGLS